MEDEIIYLIPERYRFNTFKTKILQILNEKYIILNSDEELNINNEFIIKLELCYFHSEEYCIIKCTNNIEISKCEQYIKENYPYVCKISQLI